jgi:RNA polymerase sigma factor (sigma-70 family)
MPIGQADRLMPTLRRVVLARQSAARSDGELLGAFVASGDAAAFAELVRRHGPMVLGVCRRVVGDRAAADDAFQASFLVLVRRAAAVRPREQVGNWLYGVAYRTALKARMGLARRRSREKQVDVMPEPPAPPAPPAWSDVQPIIDEELAKLPDKLRVPIVLCDLEGRPQREVARRLNVPPATLATRLAAARRALALRLTRRGVALSGGALAGLLGTHAAVSAVPSALTAGLVRAVEASATGSALHALVSANAVQLSEGVMRMMMLAKLKAVAATAVTVLALTTGLGLGLVPASAGDDAVPAVGPGSGPGPGVTAEPAPAKGAGQSAAERLTVRRAEPAEPDDATFLRRLCLDVRGTPPTDVETWFFVSDGDDDKRAKLVGWLSEDDAAKALLAKKLGVPPARIRVVRVKDATDGPAAVTRAGIFVGQGAGEPATALRVTRAAEVWNLDARPDGSALHTLIRRPSPPTNDTDAPAVKGKPDTGKPVPSPSWVGADALPFPLTNLVGQIRGDVTSELSFVIVLDDSDAEFLNRVLSEVRGNGPTALERKYFTEDKDPKKREKLIDTLLKDPDVQKKLGAAWKAKMLAAKPGIDRAIEAHVERLFLYPDGKQPEARLWRVIPDAPHPPKPPAPPKPPQTGSFQLDGLRVELSPEPPAPPKPAEAKPPEKPRRPAAPQPPAPPSPAQADKFAKLVGELIAAKKSDEAILEALTLATLSRLPTDNEKTIVLASIGTVTDRKAAWVAVARALAGTDEPKKPQTFEFRLQLDAENLPAPKTPATPTKP